MKAVADGFERAEDDVVASAAAVRTMVDLAAVLRDLRRRHARQQRDSPLTYRELAARTGWSQAVIAEYFAGRTLPPTDRFDVLVGLLGASPAERGVLATGRDRVEEARRDRVVEEVRRAGAPPAGDTAGPPVARQLPADLATFAGRAGDLARLDALLDAGGRTPAPVVLAVSGTAGVGKTALAVHWAHRIADRFRDGQLYVNLRGFDLGGPVMEPADALRRFLDALGVAARRIPAGLDAQAALYRTMLADKKVLILVDNARDCAQVRPLLPGAPGCLALVTSRNQLAGLVAADGARLVTLDLPSPADARDLLAARLGADRVTAEPEAVGEIIDACARLPLALAIVATRAVAHPQWPLQNLADELVDAGSRLDPMASADDPHTNVREVFSWSYHALTAPAARLFGLLGLHRGPDISAPAAASLATLSQAEVRTLLAELVRTNLLVEHTAGRYTFHELLRAYASEQAHTAGADEQYRAISQWIVDHELNTAYTTAVLLDPGRERITLAVEQPVVNPEHTADRAPGLSRYTAEDPSYTPSSIMRPRWGSTPTPRVSQ